MYTYIYIYILFSKLPFTYTSLYTQAICIQFVLLVKTTDPLRFGFQDKTLLISVIGMFA